MTDVLELTYKDVADVDHDPVWETLCELGRAKVQAKDGNQWELGDLALEVDKAYGQNRIAAWAHEIGIAPSTASTYRGMSRYYENNLRKLFPNLSYTHYLKAMIPQKYMADGLSESMLLLTDASNLDWTSGQIGIARNTITGKPKPAKRVANYTGKIIEADDITGQIVFQFDAGANVIAMQKLLGQHLRMKLFEEAAA